MKGFFSRLLAWTAFVAILVNVIAQGIEFGLKLAQAPGGKLGTASIETILGSLLLSVFYGGILMLWYKFKDAE